MGVLTVGSPSENTLFSRFLSLNIIKLNNMKPLYSTALLCLLSGALFSQVTVTINGNLIKPNHAGINVHSGDMIEVTIADSSLDSDCTKNLFLQIAITKKEKNTAQSQQQQQQSFHPPNPPKDHCDLEGYKKVPFKLTHEKGVVCRFRAGKYWKKPEGAAYIFLCQQSACISDGSALYSEISNFNFFLLP